MTATRGNIGVKNIREISRLFIPQRFESHTPNFELNSFTHRKPVQLLGNRRNMIEALTSWNNACNGVLDPLELGKVLNCHAIDVRVAVVDSWGDYGTCNCLALSISRAEQIFLRALMWKYEALHMLLIWASNVNRLSTMTLRLFTWSASLTSDPDMFSVL